MSSINNNGSNNNTPYSANNDGQQASLQQLAEQRAQQQARKTADKAVIDGHFANLDIIKLVGMTPQDAVAALNGSPKSNKYSAAGAVSNLSPPSAPKMPITPKTQALYTSLHEDINQAIGSVAAGEQPLNLAALTPTMHAATSPAQAQAQVDQASAAATKLLQAGGAQFAKISSNQMTMAFMMLRGQGQQQGLNINNQMGDMQSAIRKADLDEQIKSDKEAQVKLDKAAKKQAVMKKLGPVFEAVIAVLTAVIAVLSVGTAMGLALVVAAMVAGFVIGGAAGGAKNHNGFDLQSAVTGLSIGAAVVPMGAILKGVIESITKAVEKGIATAIKEASEKVLKKTGIKASEDVGETGASTAARTAARAVDDKKASIQATQREESEKLLNRADADATDAADRAINAMAGHSKTNPNFLKKAAGHISQEIQNLLPKAFRDTFSAAQKAADTKFDAFKTKQGFSEEKISTAIENAMLLQILTPVPQMFGNFSVQQENINAQKDLLAGKQWGLFAKIAQDSWKGTQDFLSAMQDQHNSGLSQIQQMLATHNQASMLAISHILG